MPATCPQGHVSESEDYCDTCGAPIAAGGEQPPPLPAPAEGPAGGENGSSGPAAGADAAPASAPDGAKRCPNCATDNDGEALFCENCGYDFTTGALPRPQEPVSELDLGAPAAPAVPGESSIAPPIPPSAGPGPATAGGEATEEPSWVAEVWVDPDWYAQQDADDPCPSPGLPATIPLTARSLLVGRTSASRNIHPQIDVSTDVGVSRRHAQLTTDGQRWWVEDLQSSNGTFVGAARAPLPTQALPAGQRRELDEDDRVYLGAWTRIVIRRALPGEQF